MKRYFLPIIIILVGVIVSAGVFFVRRDTNDLDSLLLEQQEKLDFIPGDLSRVRPPDGTDHILGNPNAPVKIIEFSDMECSFCKIFHKTMENIMKTYGREGKVAWIYRHLPIDSVHSKSRTEAVAAECAGEIGGPNMFWEYVSAVFDITPSNNGLELSLLPEIADSLGLNVNKFEECLASGRYDVKIEDDFNDAINSGASGAPYSLVFTQVGDTFIIPGSKSYNIISLMIERALKEI